MRKLFRRIHYLLHRRRLERELDDEMAAHREMMAPGRRSAFGSTLRLREEVRDTWGWLWLDHLRQDLFYAARGFVREPRFTLSALAAVLLAVGAATAVFSVADRSLFRPLPYRQGDRLVTVGIVIPALGMGDFMFWGAYRDWRATQTAVDLTSWSGVTACDVGGETPQRLSCARVESTFLPALGVQPVLGRNITFAEDQRGAAPVALLSYGMWRTHFGADPGILGRSIELDGAATRIIGVLPANFETPDLTPADIVVPQRLPVGPHTQNYEVSAIGRLRPGESAASGAGALAGPFERFRVDFGQRVGGNFEKAMRLHIEPLRDRQIRQYRAALWMLLGAVAAFVLIACTNVTNLLLARAAGRRQESAVRAALGASRGRLVGQALTESALLGVAGGAAGCGLAWVLLRAWISLAPEGTLRLRDASLDARVLAFALILSLGTALVFGLAPSFDALRVEAFAGARVAGHRKAWLRQGLMIGQLSVSLLLLSGAGLLLMSLERLESTPLGFARERIVTASFTLPVYRYGQDERQIAFFNELSARLRDVPGAIATAITDSVPPGEDARTAPYAPLVNPEASVTDRATSGSVKWRYVSQGYFEALAIPIRRGRDFSDEDVAHGLRNVIISESLARRFYGSRDPIGARLGRHTVIGVAGDVRNAGLDRPADPEYYEVRKATREGVPGSGDPAWWRRATVIVRSTLGERDATESLRATIRDVDAAVPVQLASMQSQVDRFLTRPRFQTALFALFALTGLILAVIGLYGLISFLVAERTREIGVRIALGATPADVEKLVVSGGARWTAAGVALGLGASLLVLRLLQGLLYQVQAFDVRVLAGATALLASVAILASWIPARRAARTDPVTTLRHD